MNDFGKTNDDTLQFDELCERTASKSHPEYPWLSRVYAPSSRIPCTDLTPIVRDLLKRGNRTTIKWIMHAVLKANPGLFIGIGPNCGMAEAWVDRIVDEIATKDFSNYVRFRRDPNDAELRAFFIVKSKDGGGREFWLTDRTPELLTSALSVNEPEWGSALEQLQLKANAFIRKMRVDTPYWRDYQLFNTVATPALPVPSKRCLELVRSLPLGGRLQLAYLIGRGGGSAATSTDYAIRSLGLDINESFRLIVEAGLLRAAVDPEIGLAALTREDLLAAAVEARLDVRKSWAKRKLVAALVTCAPQMVGALLEANPTFEIAPEFSDDLRALARYAAEQTTNFALLAFA
jgi:hypothetical protein